MTLDPERLARYSRQLVIPAIGDAGQVRLGEARVRVIGAAGPVVPGLVYLALAGVGTIWVDDAEPVGEGDVGHWLYPPVSVGAPRARAAAAALRERSRFVSVHETEPPVPATAVLVFAANAAEGVSQAEHARKAGLPHVVAEPDGDGGTVVTVPVGAPCHSCARSVGSTWRPLPRGGSALAALAAQELILLLADPSSSTGRRIDLTRGVPSARPTARLAGCACGVDIGR